MSVFGKSVQIRTSTHNFNESKFWIFDTFYDNTGGDDFDAPSLTKDCEAILYSYVPYHIDEFKTEIIDQDQFQKYMMQNQWVSELRQSGSVRSLSID